VALGQVLLLVLRFSPVSIISPVLYTHLYFNTALMRRISGRDLGTFKQSSIVWDLGDHWTGKHIHKGLCAVQQFWRFRSVIYFLEIFNS
jgi:hypothetical protein